MGLIEKRGASRSDLKWFGLIIAGVFIVLGAMARLKGHHTIPVVLWSIGIALALVYYSIKALRHLMFDLWMGITYPIGSIVSHILMALMFYGVITPVGLLMRLFGRDPMQRAFDRSAASYWEPHDPSAEPGRYFRQF